MYNYIIYIILVIFLTNKFSSFYALEDCINNSKDKSRNFKNSSIIYEMIRKDDSDLRTKANEFLTKAAEFNKKFLIEENSLLIDKVELSCLFELKNENNSIHLYIEFQNFTSTNEDLYFKKLNFSLLLLESILVNQLRIEKSLNIKLVQILKYDESKELKTSKIPFWIFIIVGIIFIIFAGIFILILKNLITNRNKYTVTDKLGDMNNTKTAENSTIFRNKSKKISKDIQLRELSAQKLNETLTNIEEINNLPCETRTPEINVIGNAEDIRLRRLLKKSVDTINYRSLSLRRFRIGLNLNKNQNENENDRIDI